MGSIDTDDLEHKHKLLIERTLFRDMLPRLSIISLVAGAALYCIGIVLNQQSVVGTFASFTVIPMGCCLGMVAEGDIWQSGGRLKLGVHKLCMTLLCTLLGFDLGTLCVVIGA